MLAEVPFRFLVVSTCLEKFFSLLVSFATCGGRALCMLSSLCLRAQPGGVPEYETVVIIFIFSAYTCPLYLLELPSLVFKRKKANSRT